MSRAFQRYQARYRKCSWCRGPLLTFPDNVCDFTFLQVYISVFRHESVMEKIAKNTLLKKIFSLTRERWGRIPYTPPRRCAPHRGDTPHTPRAPRVCFSIFRYFFPTLKILDVLNSTRNYNFFFEIFLYFFCEIFKFQNPLFGGNFRPKCFRSASRRREGTDARFLST